MKSLSLAVLLCLLSVPAFAQVPPVINPGGVEFAPSPNHSDPAGSKQEVVKYTLDVSAATAPTVVVKSLDMGKPPIVNAKVTVTSLDAFFASLPVGNYVAVVKAEGPGGASPSAVTDPFLVTVRAPAAPGKPVWKQ